MLILRNSLFGQTFNTKVNLTRVKARSLEAEIQLQF